jgi:hypothetical protein
MRQALALSMLLISGCALPPKAPRGGEASFVIERDLVGSTTARGTFQAINGLRRGFSAELSGVWDGRTYRLNEKFAYDDGERDEKTWVLNRKPDGTYTGTREDVVGEARGWQDGKYLRLAYDVMLPGKDGKPGMKVRFQDVMAMMGDGRIVNNATVGKWGFWVGKVELIIERTGSKSRP